MGEALKMSHRDIDRLRVIRDVLDKKLTQVEAAGLLGLSDRQVRRLCVDVRERGNRGILHGLTGLPSNNQLDPKLLEMALSALWTVYIDDHNTRFAVDPTSPTNAHRPLLADQRLDEILSLRTERAIANDYAVRFQKRFFQLFEDQPVRVRPKDKIEVEIRLDETTHLRAKGAYLRFKPIEKRPYRPHLVMRPSSGKIYDDPRIKGRGSKPAPDHPWRRLFSNGPHRVALAPGVVRSF